MLKVKEINRLLDGTRVSEQEYLQEYNEVDGIKYEYVNGRLKSIGMSVKKVERNGIFFIKLFEAYFDNPQTVHGIVLNQFIFPTPGQQYHRNFRRPDICVIVNDSLQDNDSKTDRIDIAIELISLSTKSTDHQDKKTEYQARNVAYYFILDKIREDSKFYQLNNNHEYEEIPLLDNDIIELPQYKGLKFRLSDLFALKDIEILSNDPLYNYSFGYLRNVGRVEGRAEGRAEGRVEGRVEGLKVGEERGIQIGKNEGKTEEKQEIAKNLKSMGLSIEQIMKATELSKKNIENL